MTMTTTVKASKSLAEREAALRRGEPASWGQIGLWLDEVERTAYWQVQAKSFTEWLKSTAPGLGVKEGSLWRYLTASRYYGQLRNHLQKQGGKYPPLSRLPDTVSPENLELLSKIERVAPESVLQDLATRIIDASISRAELRRCWQTYRRVLHGQTARGTGVDIPRYDPGNVRQADSMLEANVMAILHVDGHAWTGASPTALYRLHQQVSVRSRHSRNTFRVLDAVAVTQGSDKEPLCFHVIEILGGHTHLSGLSSRVSGLAPYGDLLWLAFPEGAVPDTDDIPPYVGILQAGRGMKVVRPAKPDPSLGAETGNTAKGLLLKTLQT